MKGGEFDCHKVELAVWTHYVVNDLKPELLVDTLASCGKSVPEAPAAADDNAQSEAPSSEAAATAEGANGTETKQVQNGAEEDSMNSVNSIDSTASTDGSAVDEESNGASAAAAAASEPETKEVTEKEVTTNGAMNGNGNHSGQNGDSAKTNGTSEEATPSQTLVGFQRNCVTM